MDFVGTAWALLPPIIAITLALITKEVYISLFVGIVTGAMLYADFSPIGTLVAIFEMMMEKLADTWNIGILIFLVFLGIIVTLMTKAGGSAAYGKWANGKIKKKSGALLSTFGLGALIFVDDYFNCLTVGSVMRPITDKHKISRAKLAYIIDATAAPICIIAPISSWAAAVTGYTEGDGFSLFLQTIPFNLYAWLTIVMVIFISIFGFDFGPMKKHEDNAANGDLFSGKNDYEQMDDMHVSNKGRVFDLVLPIIFLIVSCVLFMVYTGKFFENKGFFEAFIFFDGNAFIAAFADCNASLGLALGSFVTLVFMFLLYLPRRVISYKDFTDAIPQGFRVMIAAILILILAWTLGGFCSDRLDAGAFVAGALNNSSFANSLFPAVLFLIGTGLAFATGTSWGTFGILIPIITAVFPADAKILVISIAAVLAGAVCGDHISPISDTTIMASAGAQCNHVNHVSTQIPYAMVVAACCFIGYIVAGITENVVITLLTGLVLLIGTLLIIRAKVSKTSA